MEKAVRYIFIAALIASLFSCASESSNNENYLNDSLKLKELYNPYEVYQEIEKIQQENKLIDSIGKRWLVTPDTTIIIKE